MKEKIIISLVAMMIAIILIMPISGCAKPKNNNIKEIPICHNLRSEQPKIIYTESQGYCLMMKK